MRKYELNKCTLEIENMPKSNWHNGMVIESGYDSTVVIAIFDNLEDAKKELKKYKCEAKYLGGSNKTTKATEYWIEENEYDKNDVYVETIRYYNGEYINIR